MERTPGERGIEMHINRQWARMRGHRPQGGVSVVRSDLRKVVRGQGRRGLIKYVPAFAGFGHQIFFFCKDVCIRVRVFAAYTTVRIISFRPVSIWYSPAQ